VQGVLVTEAHVGSEPLRIASYSLLAAQKNGSLHNLRFVARPATHRQSEFIGGDDSDEASKLPSERQFEAASASSGVQ
jgi:hypothetical protein